MRSHLGALCAAATVLLGSATLARATEGDGTAADPFVRGARGDGRIISGIAAQRSLHLTFDDGPAEGTPRVLDVLDAHHVRATFFLVGRHLRSERERDIAREILRRGHAIGLHSYAHHDYTRMSDAALAADLDRAEEAFVATFGARPHMFRPPYGRHDARVDEVLTERGYTQVRWTLVAGDRHASTPEAVLAAFRAALDGDNGEPGGIGGILLLHDTRPAVVDALPSLLDEIDARNCDALARGEELWDLRDDLADWYEWRHWGPASGVAVRMRLAPEVLAARQAELRASAASRCGGSSALSE